MLFYYPLPNLKSVTSNRAHLLSVIIYELAEISQLIAVFFNVMQFFVI